MDQWYVCQRNHTRVGRSRDTYDMQHIDHASKKTREVKNWPFDFRKSIYKLFSFFSSLSLISFVIQVVVNFLQTMR